MSRATSRSVRVADRAPVRLRLLGRSYCHLCDDMRVALAPWIERNAVTLEWVDVDADAGLEALHGEKVPVLFAGDQEICHYFLDESRLREVLAAIG